MGDWKVIYVNSRAEKKVTDKLIELGIEAYTPIKKEKRKWSDRIKWVEFPLIKGYVFVKPTDVQRDKILQVSGVMQYVRYNKSDAVIRECEIEVLRSIEEKGYYVEGHFGTKIVIGDEAIIQAGPFKGFRGQVKKAGEKEIYTLNIESIDYSLVLHVPRDVLKKKN